MINRLLLVIRFILVMGMMWVISPFLLVFWLLGVPGVLGTANELFIKSIDWDI